MNACWASKLFQDMISLIETPSVAVTFFMNECRIDFVLSFTAIHSIVPFTFADPLLFMLTPKWFDCLNTLICHFASPNGKSGDWSDTNLAIFVIVMRNFTKSHRPRFSVAATLLPFSATVLLFPAVQLPVHQSNFTANDVNRPNADPVPPNKRQPRPVAPNDCNVANRLPAATAPILDCHAAAVDPATIPPTPNPINGSNMKPKPPSVATNPAVTPPRIIHRFFVETIGRLQSGHFSKTALAETLQSSSMISNFILLLAAAHLPVHQSNLPDNALSISNPMTVSVEFNLIRSEFSNERNVSASLSAACWPMLKYQSVSFILSFFITFKLASQTVALLQYPQISKLFGVFENIENMMETNDMFSKWRMELEWQKQIEKFYTGDLLLITLWTKKKVSYVQRVSLRYSLRNPHTSDIWMSVKASNCVSRRIMPLFSYLRVDGGTGSKYSWTWVQSSIVCRATFAPVLGWAPTAGRNYLAITMKWDLVAYDMSLNTNYLDTDAFGRVHTEK